MANGGTLFLDETGDLPMALQAKLLRFLQERVIERVGGREEIPVDIRVICATHQNIPEQIKEGTFREDLYYRISEISLKIPALREREGDVVLIARMLLNKYLELPNSNKKIRGFAQDAIVAMESYAWPGNVRELENRIKRAVIMAESNMISAEDLELEDIEEAPVPLNLRQVRDQAEYSAVLRAINLYNGNISKAAELLGVSRPTLYDLMNKHEIK